MFWLMMPGLTPQSVGSGPPALWPPAVPLNSGPLLRSEDPFLSFLSVPSGPGTCSLAVSANPGFCYGLPGAARLRSRPLRSASLCAVPPHPTTTSGTCCSTCCQLCTCPDLVFQNSHISHIWTQVKLAWVPCSELLTPPVLVFSGGSGPASKLTPGAAEPGPQASGPRPGVCPGRNSLSGVSGTWFCPVSRGFPRTGQWPRRRFPDSSRQRAVSGGP